MNESGTDPLGMFLLFLKRTADVLATRLTVVFRRFLRFGSFLFVGVANAIVANATSIPKDPTSCSVAKYRSIS